jgi:hypothetical protein
MELALCHRSSPRICRWLLDFWKIFIPLHACNHHLTFPPKTPTYVITLFCCKHYFMKWRAWLTNGRTDRQTDIQTNALNCLHAFHYYDMLIITFRVHETLHTRCFSIPSLVSSRILSTSSTFRTSWIFFRASLPTFNPSITCQKSDNYNKNIPYRIQ